MDTRDRFWIFTATAVAIASIGLSAFIVAFAPEDPYSPASRAALQSNHPLQVPASAAANERRATGNAREAALATEDLWSAGSDHRLGYVAGGAVAGIALMFAVMGLLDRSGTPRVVEGERLDMGSCKIATATGAPSCTRDGDDAEVSPSIAMIALGFGAFVDRNHPQPVPCYLHATIREAVKLDEHAIAFHRLAAGYGAAAIESHRSANRRRADRRNPFAARAIVTTERRRAARRISDANCEPRNTVARRSRSFAATRQEAVY